MLLTPPPLVLLDVWGVLHDGREPYADAQPFLNRMNRAGTAIRLVSNASWTAAMLRDHLQKLGFDLSVVEEVFTAGDDARLLVRQLQPDGVYYEGMHDLVPGVRTATLADCDLVVFANLTPNSESVLQWAFEHEIPVVCANPDVAIWDRLGRAIPKAGGLARTFAERGAIVHFSGKPSPGIFRRAAPEGAPLIGDSPATDLAGANAAGIPAIWLRRRKAVEDPKIIERYRPVATVSSLDEVWPMVAGKETVR